MFGLCSVSFYTCLCTGNQRPQRPLKDPNPATASAEGSVCCVPTHRHYTGFGPFSSLHHNPHQAIEEVQVGGVKGDVRERGRGRGDGPEKGFKSRHV